MSDDTPVTIDLGPGDLDIIPDGGACMVHLRVYAAEHLSSQFQAYNPDTTDTIPYIDANEDWCSVWVSIPLSGDDKNSIRVQLSNVAASRLEVRAYVPTAAGVGLTNRIEVQPASDSGWEDLSVESVLQGSDDASLMIISVEDNGSAGDRTFGLRHPDYDDTDNDNCWTSFTTLRRAVITDAMVAGAFCPPKDDAGTWKVSTYTSSASDTVKFRYVGYLLPGFYDVVDAVKGPSAEIGLAASGTGWKTFDVGASGLDYISEATEGVFYQTNGIQHRSQWNREKGDTGDTYPGGSLCDLGRPQGGAGVRTWHWIPIDSNDEMEITNEDAVNVQGALYGHAIDGGGADLTVTGVAANANVSAGTGDVAFGILGVVATVNVTSPNGTAIAGPALAAAGLFGTVNATASDGTAVKVVLGVVATANVTTNDGSAAAQAAKTAAGVVATVAATAGVGVAGISVKTGYDMASDLGTQYSLFEHSHTRHEFYDSVSATWLALPRYTDSDHWIYEWDGTAAANSWTRHTDADADIGNRDTGKVSIFWDDANRQLHILETHTTGGFSRYLMLTYSGSGVWVTTISAEDPGVATHDASFTVADDGEVWIVYESGGVWQSRYRNSGTWTDGDSFGTIASAGNSAVSVHRFKNAGASGIGCIYSVDGGGGSWRHAYRADSASKSATWSDELITAAYTTDNHLLSIGGEQGDDTTSTVVGAVKDGSDNINILRRTAAGSWSNAQVATSRSRPKIVLNLSTNEAYVVAPNSTGISSVTAHHVWTVDLSDLTVGSPVKIFELASPGSNDYDDNSVPSHGVTDQMGLPVLCSSVADQAQFNIIFAVPLIAVGLAATANATANDGVVTKPISATGLAATANVTANDGTVALEAAGLVATANVTAGDGTVTATPLAAVGVVASAAVAANDGTVTAIPLAATGLVSTVNVTASNGSAAVTSDVPATGLAATVAATAGVGGASTYAETRVIDLLAVKGSSTGEIDLTWTAPNNGSQVAVDSYEIRRSIKHMNTNAEHDAGTLVTQSITPKTPGEAESFTVTGLQGGQCYQFSVRPKVSAVLADWAGSAASLAMGDDIPDLTSSTVISSLPTTLSTGGKYHLTGDLSATGTGITVTANGVTINLNGFKITYNTGNTSNNEGIFVNGADDCRITNGTIEEDVLDNGVSANYAVRWGGTTDNIRIDHCVITSKSLNSHAILVNSGAGTGVFELDYCIIRADGDTSDRHSIGVHGIKIGSSSAFQINIHHNLFREAGQSCIWVNSTAITAGSVFHHNKFIGPKGRFENSYVMNFRGGDDLDIFENYQHCYSRGFRAGDQLITGVRIHDNYIWSSTGEVTNPPSADPAGDYYTHGIKLEKSKECWVYDNFVETVTSIDCFRADALSFGFDDVAEIDNLAFNNRCKSYQLDGSFIKCRSFNHVGNPAGDTSQTPGPDLGTIIDWNVFSALSRHCRHDWSAWNIGAVENNAFRRIGADGSYAWTRLDHSDGNRFTNAEHLNPYFESGDDTVSAWGGADTSGYELDRRMTLVVKVVDDTTGDPIDGVTVNVDNVSAVEQFTGSTDSNGILSGDVFWERVEDPTITRTSFNDMDIEVIKAGYQTGNVAKTVNQRSHVEVRMKTAAAPTISDITTTPDTPTGGIILATSAMRMRVEWQPVTNVELGAYLVYVDDELAKIVPPGNTSCHLQVADAATAYGVKIKAMSAQEVLSAALDMGTTVTRSEDRGQGGVPIAGVAAIANVTVNDGTIAVDIGGAVGLATTVNVTVNDGAVVSNPLAASGVAATASATVNDGTVTATPLAASGLFATANATVNDGAVAFGVAGLVATVNVTANNGTAVATPLAAAGATATANVTVSDGSASISVGGAASGIVAAVAATANDGVVVSTPLAATGVSALATAIVSDGITVVGPALPAAGATATATAIVNNGLVVIGGALVLSGVVATANVTVSDGAVVSNAVAAAGVAASVAALVNDGAAGLGILGVAAIANVTANDGVTAVQTPLAIAGLFATVAVTSPSGTIRIDFGIRELGLQRNVPVVDDIIEGNIVDDF